MSWKSPGSPAFFPNTSPSRQGWGSNTKATVQHKAASAGAQTSPGAVPRTLRSPTLSQLDSEFARATWLDLDSRSPYRKGSALWGVCKDSGRFLSLPPAEGRAQAEAGPTWLSMGVDLQHEVGDQVKVKDALIVRLLGGTGQAGQGLPAQHRHSRAPSAHSKCCTWTA